MLGNPVDVQVIGSTLIDVGRDAHIHYADKNALHTLQKYVATGAFHNSAERFDPPKCHPRTRIAVLNEIQAWCKNKDVSLPHVMWLYGPAGAGKSAIAQTMAEKCYEMSSLAACFFFSRTTPCRNGADRLIPTIAYQVILAIPSAKPHILQALEKDPTIFSKNLVTQLRYLLIDPLLSVVRKEALQPKLIIIDGLDECKDRMAQQEIIRCFISAVKRRELKLGVLILSRPEQPIREAFSHSSQRGNYVTIALDDNYAADQDIEIFLRDSFDEIQKNHTLMRNISRIWPSDSDIKTLIRKSSGQFIFASTVIRYVKSPYHRPLERLLEIFSIGSERDTAPFVELDALNTHILESVDKSYHSTVLRIFGYILFNLPTKRYPTSTPDRIEKFLRLQSGDLELALMDCHSIITIPQSPIQQPRFSHASISDFLTDPARSGKFFLDQELIHADLARACIAGISSRDQMIRQYSIERLLYHSKRAHQDEALFRDLLQLDFSDVFNFRFDHAYNSVNSTLRYVMCWTQISWIEKQIHARDSIILNDLLYRHIKTIDPELMRKLGNFTWPIRVVEFFALLEKISAHFSYAEMLLDLDIFEACNEDNEMNFHSLYPQCEEFDDSVVRQAMIGLYTSFLKDEKRAEELHINSEVYASVALRCIEYICENTHEAYLPGSSRSREACKIGMIALPSILSSAGPRDELVVNLRQGKSAHWVQIDSARSEYLKRCDNSERQQPILEMRGEPGANMAKKRKAPSGGPVNNILTRSKKIKDA